MHLGIYCTIFQWSTVRQFAKYTIVAGGASFLSSFLYFNSICCTFISTTIATASFLETVRATEAITTLIMGKIFLQEQSSVYTYASVVPICLGVAISCNNTDSFNVVGFIIILMCNCSFSLRSALARLMKHGSSDVAEQINFFANLSLFGLVVLVPLGLFFEGAALYETFYGTSGGSAAAAASLSDIGSVVSASAAGYGSTLPSVTVVAAPVVQQVASTVASATAAATASSALSGSGLTVSGSVQQHLRRLLETFPTVLSASAIVSTAASSADAAAVSVLPAQQAATTATSFSTFSPSISGDFGILGWVFMNGVTFAIGSLMTYFVLHRTDLITHSVLNVFRRVFTISVSAVFFNVTLNFANIAGITIAILGVACFAHFKSKDSK
jgi:drug/metabolite transporter (DMT)-like permease